MSGVVSLSHRERVRFADVKQGDVLLEDGDEDWPAVVVKVSRAGQSGNQPTGRLAPSRNIRCRYPWQGPKEPLWLFGDGPRLPQMYVVRVARGVTQPTTKTGAARG